MSADSPMPYSFEKDNVFLHTLVWFNSMKFCLIDSLVKSSYQSGNVSLETWGSKILGSFVFFKISLKNSLILKSDHLVLLCKVLFEVFGIYKHIIQ